MSADRVNSGDPRSELPEASGRLRPPMPLQTPHTLAGKLVAVADTVRSLKARFGIRPYRVFIVHAYWTGNRRGAGEPVIASEREILPVPRVRDFNSVRRNLRATGLTEEGDIVIDEISAKYAEDDLTGRTPDNIDPVIPRTSLKTVEYWYEVRENRPTSPNPPASRRFSPPVATPHLSRDGFQWTIILTKQGNDRSRRGDLIDKLAE